MRRLAIVCVLLLFFLAGKNAGAQISNPYHLNGSASQDNCHCYTLTREVLNQSGSLWNVNKINLNQSFDFKFNVFLGCLDQNGADGIVFVLQPISTSVGTTGQGLGYSGITPSIGIAIDTWQNTDQNDPSFDNISIFKNGDVMHGSDDIAAPMPALASGGNIEDCQFHTLRIAWNAATKLLGTQIDGADRIITTIDLVKDIFSNNPMVYWGFTGATGADFNLQRVCTSLNPVFNVPEGQGFCYPTQVNFIDSSTSFGSIDKWYWDFGDGTIDSVQNPPTHVFPGPGNYDVKLSIVGNDGCLSDQQVKTIVIGSKPTAKYDYLPSQPCRGAPVRIMDSSTVEFGTIDKWSWVIAGVSYSTEDPGEILLPATSKVQLQVGTAEGCISDVLADSLVIRPLPCPDIFVPSAFTPNHDGQNDRFEFVAPGMASIDIFKVYNRYGQLVYSSIDMHAAWDGTYRGAPQPAGAYVYVISGRDFSGIAHSKKGTVILVR